MASRPLFNGSARVSADNNPADVALLVRFTFRVSTATLAAGDENIANATFEAEAGTALTLAYDVRKFGDGVEANSPTFARIRIFEDDDNQNATTGAVAESADLVGGNVLPRTGTFGFTPTESGSYRIALEMRNGANDFSATSDDWTIHSDGSFQRGALASPTRAFTQDKGRLRYGHRLTAIDVTERGNTAPSVFAFTTNAAGTAAEEAVRVQTTQSAAQNKQTAVEVYSFRHRRNGTSTVDATANGTNISATVHQLERAVTLLTFPVINVATTYDAVVVIASSAALHTGNTPQYTALSGAAGSGNWVHFVAGGTLFEDYQTARKLASHVVNPGGLVEEIHATHSSLYAEDVNKVPTSVEQADYISTAENMTVKSGRVVNARSEPLRGVLVKTDIVHESSGTSRDVWGIDDVDFRSLANGWQDRARSVPVSTPPAGVHRVDVLAYFPAGTSGDPALRQFEGRRVEQGSPAGVSAGKNWIAPANFTNAVIVVHKTPPGGAAVPFSVHVWDKDVERDADFTPTAKVYLNRAGGTPLATPALTKRTGTTGIYDGTFTPARPTPGNPDTYEISAAVTVGSFLKTYSTSIVVMPWDLSRDRFDPTGLFK